GSMAWRCSASMPAERRRIDQLQRKSVDSHGRARERPCAHESCSRRMARTLEHGLWIGPLTPDTGDAGQRPCGCTLCGSGDLRATPALRVHRLVTLCETAVPTRVHAAVTTLSCKAPASRPRLATAVVSTVCTARVDRGTDGHAAAAASSDLVSWAASVMIDPAAIAAVAVATPLPDLPPIIRPPCPLRRSRMCLCLALIIWLSPRRAGTWARATCGHGAHEPRELRVPRTQTRRELPPWVTMRPT